MAEVSLLSVKEQTWDKSKGRYVGKQSNIDARDLKTHDGISFGNAKITLSPGDDLRFLNDKVGLVEKPVTIITKFAGSEEEEKKILQLPEGPIPEDWPENVKELERKERERERKTRRADFTVYTMEGLPLEKATVYAGDPDDKPDRLVITMNIPGVGEGTGSLN